MVYNSTMNDNIIPFPVVHKSEDLFLSKEESVELALDIFEGIAEFLDDEGYDVDNMKDDLNVICNLMVAAITRQAGSEHFLHEVLEEMHQTLKKLIEDNQKDNDSN